LRQLGHDKRTIGLMIMAPILVLSLLSYIFNGSEYHPKIAVINAPLSYVNRLEDHDAGVTRMNENEAWAAVAGAEVDGVINFESGGPHILLEGSDPAKSGAVLKLSQNALGGEMGGVEPDVTYLYGYENMSTFDNFGPILIGFFVFFFVFWCRGFLPRERDTGTLERILATPLRRWELVMGYMLASEFLPFCSRPVIAWYSIHLLHVMMMGSFFLVLLITILTALAALTIGTFLSAFAESELQMIQFIPIVVVPQVFFSGLFDLGTMTPGFGISGGSCRCGIRPTPEKHHDTGQRLPGYRPGRPYSGRLWRPIRLFKCPCAEKTSKNMNRRGGEEMNVQSFFNELVQSGDEDLRLTQKQIDIMSAAVEIFAQKGYAATSTSEIAKRASVGRALFFHYITKKDMLLAIPQYLNRSPIPGPIWRI
jgi:ABC-2 type transport system permease protein